MTAHSYDVTFFDYVDLGARRSAKVVVPVVKSLLDIKSVLDVGCGRGVWCTEWAASGVAEFVGVDGAYVNPKNLSIATDRFFAKDLSKPFDLGRTFDLVMSLEVAEHIPVTSADTFIDNLIRHGDLVLFSAAVPGQGGEYHVNEQPYEYWRRKFATRGFQCFDAVRPLLIGKSDVERWYRYNIFLYATHDRGVGLSDSIKSTAVAPDDRIVDLTPLSWRLRNAIIRTLPRSFLGLLVQLKHHWIVKTRFRYSRWQR